MPPGYAIALAILTVLVILLVVWIILIYFGPLHSHPEPTPTPSSGGLDALNGQWMDQGGSKINLNHGNGRYLPPSTFGPFTYTYDTTSGYVFTFPGNSTTYTPTLSSDGKTLTFSNGAIWTLQPTPSGVAITFV